MTAPSVREAFTQYRCKQIAELRPWQPGDDMTGISVSAEDTKAGSPKSGDMIARNPKNHADQWLVAFPQATAWMSATPPTPSAARERIAQALLDRFIERGKRRLGGSTFREGTKINELVASYRDDFMADADAVIEALALLPDAGAIRAAAFEEAARELERSYPDHAWLNAACAAIRAAAIRAAGER